MKKEKSSKNAYGSNSLGRGKSSKASKVSLNSRQKSRERGNEPRNARNVKGRVEINSNNRGRVKVKKLLQSSSSFQDLPQSKVFRSTKGTKDTKENQERVKREDYSSPSDQDHREHFAPPPGLEEQAEYRTPVVTLIATQDDQDRRLDNFMISILPNVPKSTWYRLFRKGEIRVNKKRVKADYKIAIGDQIRIAPIVLVKNTKNTPELEDLVKLNSIKVLQESILYEDKYLIAINKPSGIAVHGGSGLNYGVIEALRVLNPKEKRLELVHRIDRDTSGILLIAKRPTPLKVLQEQFRNKTINKEYTCMMPGLWTENQVNAPLLRYEKFGERFVKVDEEGKASVTNFSLLNKYKDKNGRLYSLVQARPLTGRTHQIRVHALHALNPLLGDSKYNDRDELNYQKNLGLERLFLHASRITFRHPVTEEFLVIEAKLPPELLNFINSLEEA